MRPDMRPLSSREMAQRILGAIGLADLRGVFSLRLDLSAGQVAKVQIELVASEAMCNAIETTLHEYVLHPVDAANPPELRLREAGSLDG